MASTREELFAAIDAADVDRVRELVRAEPSLAAARDDAGVSALMRGRYGLDKAIVRAILDAGPELDVFEAAALGDLDALVALLDENPADVTGRSADGFTALHLAAFFGRQDAVRLLLDRGADADAAGSGWMTGTPLHSATAADLSDVVILLLEAGANPDPRQSGGFSPLHAAAQNGNASVVDALLERGADPSATTDDGRTALDLAEASGDPDTIARLEAETRIDGGP